MKTLLTSIFNHDFAGLDGAGVRDAFFARPLTLADLAQVSAFVQGKSVSLGGREISAAMRIGPQDGEPLAILAQLHGNEPCGLAGILLAMALDSAGLLKRGVVGAIGNPLAARQYFAALALNPQARQETRDAYRCGLAEDGTLLPDMNRIPVDFLTRPASDHHTKRAQELYALGTQVWGIADLHSARGNMVCITDHKHDSDLKFSPIRSILTELAEAISAHASSTVTVQTLKTILSPLDSMKSQTGIEAGRHEAPETPHIAASFTLSLLHTLGITDAPPLHAKEDGKFLRYAVRPRLTYADLDYGDTLRAEDKVYMAKACHALASVPERSDTVVVKRDGNYALQSVAEFTQKPAGEMAYAVYQYDEMEAVEAGQVVAVAVPSGTKFTAKEHFSVLFISKSAALYDKDPAVGPWPVAADKIGNVKFCYPCDVSETTLDI